MPARPSYSAHGAPIIVRPHGYAASGEGSARGPHAPNRQHRSGAPEGVAVSADLLSVRDLTVSFRTETGKVRALFGVSFSLSPGETLGLVGGSGRGKTVRALSLLKLLPSPPAVIEKGAVCFGGRD